MKKSMTIPFLVALGVVPVLAPCTWAQSYSSGSVTNGGSVAGMVTFAGGVVERGPVAVTTDQEICGQTPKLSAELIVNPSNHGIENVVVSISDISAGKDWNLPDGGLSLDQQGCSFNPHVLIVPAGQSFDVLNNDGLLHNVHTHGHDNRPINKAQPKFLTTLAMTLRQPEFVRVTCNVHSWMEGWIAVAEHPYYVVTGEDGSYRIENVPPGDYTLEFWHETLGSQTQTITIAAGAAAGADVTFSANQ